jgi:hypothetical protein
MVADQRRWQLEEGERRGGARAVGYGWRRQAVRPTTVAGAPTRKKKPMADKGQKEGERRRRGLMVGQPTRARMPTQVYATPIRRRPGSNFFFLVVLDFVF